MHSSNFEEIKQILDLALNSDGQVIYVKSPGRINIIGGHTDYNKGLVLPGAIDRYMYLACVPNNTNFINVVAIDKKQEYKIDLNKLEKCNLLWVNFLIGILIEFKNNGVELFGFDCSFTSEVPIGAGMSSSSALECAFLMGLNVLFDSKFEKWDLINMSQSSNHNFLGLNGGILDQFASLFGKKDRIIFLDCDSLKYQYASIPASKYSWILINTCVKHNLIDSGYNDRVKECQQALSDIQKIDANITSLSDANVDLISKIKFSSDTIRNRAKYIVEENLRVRSFISALEKGDFQTCGQVLYATHEGLSKEYEVSCPELDFIVDILKDKSYVLGSRMMGGGFGGCTINIVENNSIEQIKKAVIQPYTEKFNLQPEFYTVEISEGASRIDI